MVFLVAVAAIGISGGFVSSAKADHVYGTWGAPGYWIVDQTSLTINPGGYGVERTLRSNTVLVCASPSYQADQRITVQWLAWTWNAQTNAYDPYPAYSLAEARTVHAGSCTRFYGWSRSGYGRYTVDWRVWWQKQADLSTFAYQGRMLEEVGDYALFGQWSIFGSIGIFGGRATVG
jgi:hypothetical protein